MSSKFVTLELAKEFARDCSNLQCAAYNIKDQLSRASLSIALNLAEGAGRFTKNEKRRFYRIAYGSLKECQTILQVHLDTRRDLHQKADAIGAKLWKLLESIDVAKRCTVNRKRDS